MAAKKEADESQTAKTSGLFRRHFGDLKTGAFVEVGSYNGRNWSHVARLADIGWRGLMLEPQRDKCLECRKEHKKNKNVVVECVAVGAYPGRALMTLGGSLSTLCPDTVETYTRQPKMAHTGLKKGKTIKVEVTTLTELFEKHKWPRDFEVLSIDVEGMELQVLRGLDISRWRPKMMIIETHAKFPNPCMSWKAIPIGCLLDHWGYKVVHEDWINSTYVEKGLC